jgi:uncharacterized membrane protein
MRPQMKTTILISVLGLSVALNAAFAIGHLHKADTRTTASGVRDENGDRCLLDRLKLDADQRRILSEMRRQMNAKRAAFWRRANTTKADLAGAICASTFSRARLDAQLERYTKNQATMQRAVADHLLQVNAMLHPDQREAFRTLLRAEMFRGIRSLPSDVSGAP